MEEKPIHPLEMVIESLSVKSKLWRAVVLIKSRREISKDLRVELAMVKDSQTRPLESEK